MSVGRVVRTRRRTGREVACDHERDFWRVHRRKLKAMTSRAIPFAVLAVFVMAVAPASAGRQGTNTLPPPGVRSNPAWHTVTTGPTAPAQQLPPQLFALSARSNADALVPFGVFDGLKKLDASGALIWATTSGKAGHPYTFKHAAWPPRLKDFRLDHGWEGQPLPRIQQRLLWISVGGWNLDVRVYFGTQHPSKRLLTSVQAELDRLTLPTP
jgi:hypothetical protein